MDIIKKPVKVIVFGDNNVGKSALLNRYVNKHYSPNTRMTMGMDLYTKEIFLDNRKLRMQVRLPRLGSTSISLIVIYFFLTRFGIRTDLKNMLHSARCSSVTLIAVYWSSMLHRHYPSENWTRGGMHSWCTLILEIQKSFPLFWLATKSIRKIVKCVEMWFKKKMMHVSHAVICSPVGIHTESFRLVFNA